MVLGYDAQKCACQAQFVFAVLATMDVLTELAGGFSGKRCLVVVSYEVH